MAEFLSTNYADAIRHKITSNRVGPRVLNSGPGLINLRYTLACAIVIVCIIFIPSLLNSSDPQLQHAFSADWNWANIRAFDPFYSLDLADAMETVNFFEEVNSMTSELVASWDIIFPQIRETINLTM